MEVFHITNNFFKRIIVPFDGSESSKKAAQKAMMIAQQYRIPIQAIHVIEQPISLHNSNFPSAFSPVASYGPTTVEIYNQQKKEQSQYLQTLNEQAECNRKYLDNISKKFDISLHTKVVQGSVEKEIMKESKKTDLIIMGSKGQSSLERFLIGDTSEKILHHVPSSVMIIK